MTIESTSKFAVRLLGLKIVLTSILVHSLARADELITPEKLRELVEKSFDVQAAKAQVIENRASVIRAFDPYIPDFSLNAQSYAFSESYRVNRSPVYLNVGVTLFDKGRDIFGIQRARSEVRISEQNLEADRKDALIRAYELYFQLVETKANLRTLGEIKKELGAVLERARALVAARAMMIRQLTRLEVEATLHENRIISANANLVAARSRFMAELQIEASRAWDVPLTTSGSIPKEFLTTTDVDLERAAGVWNRSVALAERSYNLDSPTRWLAYSDQLPKLDLRASLGRPDFNSVRNEMAIRASLEIPLPVFDVPIMLKPINTIIDQAVRQNEVRRAETLADLRAQIEARTARLNAAINQLQQIETPLEKAKTEKSDDRQEILAAGGQALNYLLYINQTRELELAKNAANRTKDTEYRALRVLRGMTP